MEHLSNVKNPDPLRESWNKFALDMRHEDDDDSADEKVVEPSIGLWRKHFAEDNLVDVARKIFIWNLIFRSAISLKNFC